MEKEEIIKTAQNYYEEFRRRIDENYFTAYIAEQGKKFIKYYTKHYIILSKYYNYFPSNRCWRDRIVMRDTTMIGTDCFLKNNIKYPSKEGLYLIGQTNFNPHTKEEFYWIKVGWGGNLSTRRRQYNTYTAMIWDIGYCVDNQISEYKCHEKLLKIALHRHADEWFSVSRENYLKICEQGFEWFKEDE